jgi:hypothetical protein
MILFTKSFAGNHKQDSIPTNDSTSSQLLISFNYQSQAVESGRTYNVKQYSLLPSVMYTHKSGIFASADGIWLSEATPAYSLTVVTAGYSKTFAKRFNVTASFARNFFNPDSAGIIRNQLSVGGGYEINWFNITAGYTYLSGEEKGHLLTVGTSGYWEKELKRAGVFSISPNIVFSAGTANVPFRSFGKTTYERGYKRPWVQQRRNMIQQIPQQTKYEFGPMSINASLPLSLSKGLFAFTLSGNIVLPFALAEEEQTELKSQFFIGAGISFTIQ